MKGLRFLLAWLGAVWKVVDSCGQLCVFVGLQALSQLSGTLHPKPPRMPGTLLVLNPGALIPSFPRKCQQGETKNLELHGTYEPTIP